MQTDPIADYLTMIRNASKARHSKVDIPASRSKVSISKILRHYGYIKDYVVIEDKPQNKIRIYLAYNEDGSPTIQGLKKISVPGLRKYVGVNDLPRVFNNYGLAVMSTPKGIITDRDAKKLHVGGEVLCYVW